MNLNLKTYIKKIAGVFLLTAVASCDVLDIEPQTDLSELTAFQTPERMALAVAGVYDAAQSGFYAGGAVRGYPFGAAHVEQGDTRGEDVVNTQLFFAVTYESTYTPSAAANQEYMWATLYDLINKANIVLGELENATSSPALPQATLDAWKGECRLLRALAYHTLLIHWSRPYSDNPSAAAGGVPLRTTPILNQSDVDVAISQGRGTVAEGYSLILSDLDYAESTLPSSRAGGQHLTRATKAAAVALKTRVYLHMSNWAKVVEEGNKLAPQSTAPFSSSADFGTRSLTDTPMGAFGAANKTNTESIFSIENNDIDNASVNGALPTMYRPENIGARGLVGISPVLWNQSFWLPNDWRKLNMATDDGVTNSGKGAKFTTKYADFVARTDNAPVIRYAEVLLNVAEAIQHQSAAPDARALELLNAIRNRAVDADDQFELGDFADDKELIQAILNERRIEFVAEGLRWGDIHRLVLDSDFGIGGIPAKANRGIANYGPLYTNDPTTTYSMHDFIPYSDFRFVWPIPTQEIINNPVLAAQQNPSY